MKQLEYDVGPFVTMVENIFGAGSFKCSRNKCSNNVIGALVSSNNFSPFIHNFRDRLARLSKCYPIDDRNRKVILNRIADIAMDTTWEGAFSEITAYDYFNFVLPKGHRDTTALINLDETIDGSFTYKCESGEKGPANLDGRFNMFGIYFDVKAFKDNVQDILDTVFKKVNNNPGRENLKLVPEYSYNVHYNELSAKMNSLIEELVSAFTPETRKSFYRSNILPEYSFRAIWGSGSVSTERVYNPNEIADKYHLGTFRYYDKFTKDAPFILVYVVFPWFYMTSIEFRDPDKTLYARYSRDVFCNYTSSLRTMNSIIKEFQGPSTIGDISKAISAILFIEDKSINLTSQDESTKTNAILYLNPYARQSIANTEFVRTIKENKFTKICEVPA
jgi:hypothetical protein